MASNKIRVGVVGTGFGTIVHIPAFQSCPDSEVVAVCSAHQERAEAAAQKFGVPRAFTDYREMVRQPEIDLVSVSAPPFEHYPMVMAALEAGKHVLCEKPMALNLDECRAMLSKAEATGRVHMIAHEFRWAPPRAYIARLLAEGYIGQPRHVNATLFLGARGGSLANPAYTWAAQRAKGGGMLMALGSHFIDALRDWFGDFAGVYGQVATHVPGRRHPDSGATVMADADDAFSMLLRFKNGAWGTISASMAAPFGSGGRIEIYGSEGTLVSPQASFNPTPDGKVFGARLGDKELQELPVPPEYVPFEDPRDHRLLPFRLMVDRLVAAIRQGKPASPTFYDGLKVQEVINGIYQSQETGRWVEL
ncbi:MAG: Gfo/Idh/MocA family oxidoreductase [Chloroflexi bacterium]|nr:Gfo/Idh/MocA family oxidoreductase [Chloroflexota bacterium]